jgi:hypothetical protein
MPVRPALLGEIQQTLGAAIIPSLTTASAASDLYEAYLFALIVQAARSERAVAVRFRTISGGQPSPFVFRTSPGYLNSRRANYGYAEIEFSRCPLLEAHVGVRVSGQSNVLHECDVVVLLKSEADLCRTNPQRVAPRSSKIVVAVEAKYYTTDVALGLGRGFLGLIRDLSAEKAFFVINREAESVETLLAHKKQLWEHNISPNDPVSVERLRNAFQTAFKDYKARART